MYRDVYYDKKFRVSSATSKGEDFENVNDCWITFKKVKGLLKDDNYKESNIVKMESDK